MEIAQIDEKRLRTLIDETVPKHMRITIEDIEEVRRSPAGVLVRLENKVEYIEKKQKPLKRTWRHDQGYHSSFSLGKTYCCFST
jgi:hypothetical protein